MFGPRSSGSLFSIFYLRAPDSLCGTPPPHTTHHTERTNTMMLNDDVRVEMLADMPLYKRIRQELLAEIHDPEVSLFRNLCSLSFTDWENLNIVPLAHSSLVPTAPPPPPTQTMTKILIPLALAKGRRSARFLFVDCIITRLESTILLPTTRSSSAIQLFVFQERPMQLFVR